MPTPWGNINSLKPGKKKLPSSDRVIGTLGMVLRTLWMPDGSERMVAYIGDLKVSPSRRGQWVLARLAEAARSWAEGKTEMAFSVVMQGTSNIPAAYTGRLGIPLFKEVGRIAILRIPVAARGSKNLDGHFSSASGEGLKCFHQLTQGRFSVSVGQSVLRSSKVPQWIVSPDGSACGLLEDTRLAKRLWLKSGKELVSAHFSCFAFSDSEKGAQLVRKVLPYCARLDYPALFVAVPEKVTKAFRRALNEVKMEEAPAIIYGVSLSVGFDWIINTSEV